MSTFILRRFANPNILKKIGPKRLLQFLGSFRDYLVGRGFRWPEADTEIDYPALASIVACPDDQMPARLVHALHTVDDLATPLGAERVGERARRLGVSLDAAAGTDPSPADVAVDAWLKAEHMLLGLHDEQQAIAKRAFEYFASRSGPARLPGGMPARLDAIKRMFSAWSTAKLRGGTVEIQMDTKDRETLFLVWHGESRHRDTAILDDGRAMPVPIAAACCSSESS